jgi:hypothetical protein
MPKRKDNQDEPWAANVVFRGTRKTVKKALDALERRVEQGQIKDLQRIDGPAKSLKQLFSRWARNLLDDKSKKDDSNGSKT